MGWGDTPSVFSGPRDLELKLARLFKRGHCSCSGSTCLGSPKREAQQIKEWRRPNPDKVKAQKWRYRAAHEKQIKANERRYNRSRAKKQPTENTMGLIRRGYERATNDINNAKPPTAVPYASYCPGIHGSKRPPANSGLHPDRPRQAPGQAPAPRRPSRRAPKRSREEVLAARRLHYRQHREKILAQQRVCRRRYYEKNREAILTGKRIGYVQTMPVPGEAPTIASIAKRIGRDSRPTDALGVREIGRRHGPGNVPGTNDIGKRCWLRGTSDIGKIQRHRGPRGVPIIVDEQGWFAHSQGWCAHSQNTS